MTVNKTASCYVVLDQAANILLHPQHLQSVNWRKTLLLYAAAVLLWVDS